MGRLCMALNGAGVEASFESSFAMLELAFLNLRAAGMPAGGIGAILNAIEECYEGNPNGRRVH
jgi:hypothetical protein